MQRYGNAYNADVIEVLSVNAAISSSLKNKHITNAFTRKDDFLLCLGSAMHCDTISKFWMKINRFIKQLSCGCGKA